MQKDNVSKEDMERAIPFIVAVDFDGTLVTDKFPEVGEVISETWKQAQSVRANGGRLILWTCRDGKNLEDAVAFCKENDLEFDAVNCNIKETQELFNNDTRKVYANEYWDDKAVHRFARIAVPHPSYVTPRLYQKPTILASGNGYGSTLRSAIRQATSGTVNPVR